jgi:hypothetical protein
LPLLFFGRRKLWNGRRDLGAESSGSLVLGYDNERSKRSGMVAREFFKPIEMKGLDLCILAELGQLRPGCLILKVRFSQTDLTRTTLP